MFFSLKFQILFEIMRELCMRVRVYSFNCKRLLKRIKNEIIMIDNKIKRKKKKKYYLLCFYRNYFLIFFFFFFIINKKNFMF
jgi:hypothetical protein